MEPMALKLCETFHGKFHEKLGGIPRNLTQGRGELHDTSHTEGGKFNETSRTEGGIS